MLAASAKPLIYVSYSHKDAKWLSYVQSHLRPATVGHAEIWLDRQIKGGDRFQPEVEQHLKDCAIFVLLVSPNSMASEWIRNIEIATIRARQGRGDRVLIFPILLTPTPTTALEAIRDINIRPRNAKPLSTFRSAKRDREIADIVDEIVRHVTEDPHALASSQSTSVGSSVGTTSSIKPTQTATDQRRVLFSSAPIDMLLGTDGGHPRQHQLLNWPGSLLFPSNLQATFYSLTPGDIVLGVLVPADLNSVQFWEQFDPNSQSAVVCIVASGEQISITREGAGSVPLLVAEAIVGQELTALKDTEIDKWLRQNSSEGAIEIPTTILDEINEWLVGSGRKTIPYSHEQVGRLLQQAKKSKGREAPTRADAETADDKVTDAYVPFRSDAANESEDTLDRGPLALFLARRLHLIWCELNGYPPHPKSEAGPITTESSRPRSKKSEEMDSFIVHIDSPWGGGKTTFANFVARVLNPCKERLSERHFLRSLAPATASPDDLSRFKLDEIFFLHPEADSIRAGIERNRWPEQARKPWIPAYYNAWRDQYVQPPWWHIFLTIVASIESSLKEDIPGPFGFQSLWRLLRIKFVRLRYQIFNTKIRNQLNLMALITAAILVAWWAGIFGHLLSYASDEIKKWAEQATAILAIGGFSIATLFSILSQSFTPDLDFTAEHKQIGVRDPIGRFRTALKSILAAVERPVLLIIDDIDRCDPKSVVEVLRGFQTIIRSPRLFVLVLGDRSWIEKAHEIHHKDFSGIAVGTENTLGERFVEKLFQLSFILPVMTPEIRYQYTQEVIGTALSSQVARPQAQVSTPGQPEPVMISMKQKQVALRDIEQKFAEANRADTVSEREKRVDEIQKETEAFAAQSGVTKEEVATLASKALVAAAASDSTYQRQVANVLFGLAASLPNNPRQIKRIINAFAVYEAVGRLYFNYRLTESGNHEGQSRRWRQLAIWTTLATEWPQTWRSLAREPRYVEAAYHEDVTERAKLRNELFDGKSKDATDMAEQLLRRLTDDGVLSQLLCMKENSPSASSSAGQASAVENMFANVRIDADAIYEFNRIMWEPGFPMPLPTDPNFHSAERSSVVG